MDSISEEHSIAKRTSKNIRIESLDSDFTKVLKVISTDGFLPVKLFNN